MAHLNTVLGQMLQLFPRHVFDHIVDTHACAGPQPRKLTYWCQFVAMLFAQLAGCKSLRDLVFSLNQHVKKFYHLGLCLVKRSTLAEANEHRPAIIFAKLYHHLFAKVHQEISRRQKKSHKIKIIDSTTINLCASVFPWASFRTKKGGIKLHTVITDLLPQCVVVTEAKSHDLHVGRSLHFEAGDLLIFDRGYIDYAWMHRLHRRNVSFVTRLKTNARFEVVAVKRDINDNRVISDQIIRLSSTHGQESYPDPLRRVVFQDPESGKQYVFLSNRFDLTALQIADLYRQRWQIELFFKWIKQNLKIKAFFGTSRNAVLIQIWTALIAYILLIWLKLKSIADFDILELSRLVRTLLMERCNLWDILCPKNPPSTQNRQIPLFNFCAGH
jgi:hypothetical protein